MRINRSSMSFTVLAVSLLMASCGGSTQASDRPAGTSLTTTTVPQPVETTSPTTLAPPVTEATTTTTTIETAHSWALANQGKIANLAAAGDTADHALKGLVNNFQPSDATALNDACTTLGVAVLDAVNWDIPPGDARNNLLNVIATNTQYVHDCMSIINSSDEASLTDALQATANDLKPSQDAWAAFTSSIG